MGLRTGIILVDIPIGTIIKMAAVITIQALRHFLDRWQIEAGVTFVILAVVGDPTHLADRITTGKTHIIVKTCETITTE